MHILEEIADKKKQPTVENVSHLFGVKSLEEIDIIVHTDYGPQANMDFDHERALSLQSGTAKPMLRLYSWKPHAVSLGAHQRETDIDHAACERLGIAVVRRPTGGRAIVHADELTYSIVLPLTTISEAHRTIHDIYREVHILLLRALHRLGATTLDFEKKQPDFRAHYKSGNVAMPCFASSARHEIVQGTRKVVGSAQKLYGSVVLQHGSILLGKGHERLADILNLKSDAEREQIHTTICSRSASLGELLGRTVSFEECAEAILNTVKLNTVKN